MLSSLLVLGYAAIAAAHGDHDQKTLSGPHESLWYNQLPGDGGTQVRSRKVTSEAEISPLTLSYRQIPSSPASLLLDVSLIDNV